jgi:hypothetical protein
LLLLRCSCFACQRRSELLLRTTTMGKKGKKAQAGKPKKLTPKDVGKRLDVLVKKLKEELKGADLFAPLPPTEDCAICLVPLSRLAANTVYHACCGNMICVGCVQENEALIQKQNEEKNAAKSKPDACPFCRELRPSEDKNVRQLEARALKNDHVALHQLGSAFTKGDCGLPKDDLKALDYWIRAVELGSGEACPQIGYSYSSGRGVSKDMDRADLFYIVGALRGDIIARHIIGCNEYNSGNHRIGIRHWKVAAEAGSQLSIDALKKIYNADGKMPGKEFISKEEMDTVYRSGHEAQEEVKSEEREKHRTARKQDMKC